MAACWAVNPEFPIIVPLKWGLKASNKSETCSLEPEYPNPKAFLRKLSFAISTKEISFNDNSLKRWEYNSTGFSSYESLYLVIGLTLMPTLFAPKTLINCSIASKQNLDLFLIFPPYSSVL